jgi:hypothetical protein
MGSIYLRVTHSGQSEVLSRTATTRINAIVRDGVAALIGAQNSNELPYGTSVFKEAIRANWSKPW